jgi:cholesterol 7-dehydrogenase
MLILKEIPENGADVAHLQELHRPSTFLGTVADKRPFHDLISKFIFHEWSAKWEPCSAPNQHMASMTLHNRNIVFGYPLLVLNFSIEQIGPAFVHLRFTTTFLGGMTGAFIQTITPLEPNKHRIVHHVYTDPTFKAKLFSKFLLYGEARMV